MAKHFPHARTHTHARARTVLQRGISEMPSRSLLLAAASSAAAVVAPAAALDTRSLLLAAASAAAAVVAPAAALDNGVGLLPERGFNSWYMTHSHLTYPNYTWMPGYVLSDDMKAIATWFQGHGLQALNYSYANLDDCIVVGRDPTTHVLIPDPQAFPDGVPALAQWMEANNFLLGWYTDRGNTTCSCWAGGLQRPGSRGYEALDAQTYAEWGCKCECAGSSPANETTTQVNCAPPLASTSPAPSTSPTRASADSCGHLHSHHGLTV
jgi:hypothetical protein